MFDHENFELYGSLVIIEVSMWLLFYYIMGIDKLRYIATYH